MSMNETVEALRNKLDEERNAEVAVALFGQPGAGKSSLINKIIGENRAPVGVETDTTIGADSYEWNGLKLVDLPGYGTEKFPKEGYFDRFKIPDFDLFICVTDGKLRHADTEFFKDLAKSDKPCIFVVNKRDQMWQEGTPITELEQRKVSDVESHVGRSVKVVFTSCKDGTGLDQLNIAIMQNLDGAKRERWLRAAKAYSDEFLQEKRTACERYVLLTAGLSAANAINPIPGVDVAVDMGILSKLFDEIRKDYGLDISKLESLKQSSIPIVGRLANNVVSYAAKEGILLLLKKFATKTTVKQVSKYVPYVGQAIAASVGFGITYAAGSSYLDDCHTLAQQILEHNLTPSAETNPS